MNKDQMRALIRDVLTTLDLYSESAEELLMLTAAVESNLGEYIKQVGGPAKGFFQMEPATEDDIWNNYLRYKPELADEIEYLSITPFKERSLEWSIAYQVAMARVHYLRVKEPLPLPDDIEGLAKYWKKYYNTSLGKGTVEKAIEKYNKYVS